MPHVHAEDVIGNQLSIGLRQKAGSVLSFVTLTIGASSTNVAINTDGVTPGTYILLLESYDSALTTLVLKTDTVTIFVT